MSDAVVSRQEAQADGRAIVAAFTRTDAKLMLAVVRSEFDEELSRFRHELASRINALPAKDA